MSRTRVYLTVDVESAEERGPLGPAQGYDVRVWGRFEGRRDELGLRLLLGEMEAAGLRGTFFVEPLGADFFGKDELGRVVGEIVSRGHDVQLHLHPTQRRPDWRTRGQHRLPDDMADYSLEDQVALLKDGSDRLVAAGAPRPRAFRAGNFGADNVTWQALAAAGLHLDSSFDPGYPSCRIEWPQPEVTLFDTGAGVWELPVSNFIEPSGDLRHLQIMAVSAREVIDYFEQARKLGLGEVTLVTHSFELCHIDDPTRRRGRLNRVNLARLRTICRYLADHRDAFEVETVGALAARLPPPSGRAAAAGGRRLPRGNRLLRSQRLVEQAWKRVEARIHR
jgi:hypothetical protein